MQILLCLVLVQIASAFHAKGMRPTRSLVRLSAKTSYAPVETFKMSDKKPKEPGSF